MSTKILSIISRGMFAYSVAFMTKNELITLCKKNNIQYKHLMKKNEILDAIYKNKKENLRAKFFKKDSVVYNNLQDLILSYVCFEDDINIFRKLELKRCLNITTNLIGVTLKEKSCIIEWFIRSKYAISKDDLIDIDVLKLKEIHDNEIEKAYFISKGIHLVFKPERKKWLRYLKYNKIEQNILSINKIDFNNNYLSLILKKKNNE